MIREVVINDTQAAPILLWDRVLGWETIELLALPRLLTIAAKAFRCPFWSVCNRLILFVNQPAYEPSLDTGVGESRGLP